jgi:hypothetical protein
VVLRVGGFAQIILLTQQNFRGLLLHLLICLFVVEKEKEKEKEKELVFVLKKPS